MVHKCLNFTNFAYVSFDNIMWLTLTGTVGIPVHAVWLVTNEQTEREGNSYTEQTERLPEKRQIHAW